ncbi:LysR family transcriptional regulator [Pseudovibrio sp. Ad37]|uniref:LysR family transcriptional regulator n=1 Tax=Pseudovibrio sp. Ad37 TaxID=989422 RepID=UPI0007AE5DE1|nr:LysR family transcriptional regulator [Pseudovibrio sp. Ad37]KZL20892.1 HTH-type transcriptional activator AllS [Pseudovibrio sp. Ad37]
MRLPLAMLEVFNAIAQNGSLKGAAVALGIKPSTVSHQLKSLEEQLGTALFVRTTRSVTLTDAGRALQRGRLSEPEGQNRAQSYVLHFPIKIEKYRYSCAHVNVPGSFLK